jgi:S1-C subfamily serine protease
MRATFLTLTVAVFLAAPAPLVAGPEDSVVKVLATQRMPNALRPWANGQANEVMGSGAIIEGKRILTNAHLVMYATEVSIQPERGGDKIEAKVEMVAPDADLAVLSIKDVKFFDKHPALPRARKLPKVQDNVSIYGFPIGGNGMAITKGGGGAHRLLERGAMAWPGGPGQRVRQSRQQRRAGARWGADDRPGLQPGTRRGRDRLSHSQ